MVGSNVSGRREGLKVPAKQPKKGRLWLNDGSCIRLRPTYQNHVWPYDFVHYRTDDGRALRALNILDEFSRECLAILVARRLNIDDVLALLTELFVTDVPPSIHTSCYEISWVMKEVIDAEEEAFS